METWVAQKRFDASTFPEHRILILINLLILGKKSIQINLKYWKNWFWNQSQISRFLKAKINMQINIQINMEINSNQFTNQFKNQFVELWFSYPSLNLVFSQPFLLVSLGLKFLTLLWREAGFSPFAASLFQRWNCFLFFYTMLPSFSIFCHPFFKGWIPFSKGLRLCPSPFPKGYYTVSFAPLCKGFCIFCSSLPQGSWENSVAVSAKPSLVKSKCSSTRYLGATFTDSLVALTPEEML